MTSRSLIQELKNKNNIQSIEADETAVVLKTQERQDIVRDEGSSNFELGVIEGALNSKILDMPRLSLAYSMSEAVQNGATVGAYCLNKQPITQGKDYFIMTALKMKIYYEEKKTFDPTCPIRKFDNLAELKRAGLSLENKTANEVADIYCLIECPKEELKTLFPMNINGKDSILALWTVRISSFRVARAIATQLYFFKRPMLSVKYQISAEIEKGKKYTYPVPIIKVIGTNTKQEISEIENIITT